MESRLRSLLFILFIMKVSINDQWRNLGLGRRLAKNAPQDGAPLKIFTDLPLIEFWTKIPLKMFAEMAPRPHEQAPGGSGTLSYATANDVISDCFSHLLVIS